MRLLAIVAVLICATTVCAHATTAKEDAIAYKDCILSMSHVSDAEIEKIAKGDGPLEKKADTVANLAAARCEGNRERLVRQLQKENRTEKKYSEMPGNIKAMCILALKAQMFDAILKGRARK